MDKFSHSIPALVLLISACEAVAQIQPPREDQRELTLYVQASQVENATGTAVSAEQIEELRTRFGATIDSRWYREYAQFLLNYDASQTEYSEDSQTGETVVEGESTLIFGHPTSFYELEAGHSIRRLLASPELSPTLLSNTRERQIWHVRPTLRTHVGRANRVSLSYEHMDIRFRDLEINDSSRQGVDLHYLRDISPSLDAAIVLSQRDIEYRFTDADDYQTRTAALLLFISQRLFEYQLHAGVSEIEPLNGESYHRTIGGIQAAWQQGANRIELFANKSISDTSEGGSNDNLLDTTTSFDGATDVRDQVERVDAGLRWIYEGLCSRCALTTHVGVQRLDYVNFSANDNQQQVFETSFGYQFSSALTGRLGYLRSDSSYFGADEDTAARPDTSGQILRASADYRVNPFFDVTTLIEEDRREAIVDTERDYSVRTYSVRLRLIF